MEKGFVRKIKSNVLFGLKNLQNVLNNTCLFCFWCHKPCQHLALCVDCLKNLPWLGENVCARCALPLAPSLVPICGACQTQPPPFTRTLALFRYETPCKDFVSALKFQEKTYYAKMFGQLMSQVFQAVDLPEVLLPVPLHVNRLKKRGFNQALEIAKPISKYLKIPLRYDVCVRTCDTRQQTTLGASYRQKNLKKAFALTQPLPYQHVAIVDDVMTTGSTAAALSKVLLEAGVQQVDVWCVCRA